MFNFYRNLSPTTKLLIHGLLAIVWSGVVTGGEAAYQNFTQSGHLNLPALLVTAWTAFLLYLIPAMYAYVPAHTQQLIQAAYEEKAKWYDAAQRSQNVTSAVIATQGKAVQSTTPQPHIVVPVPANFKPEDIQSIAAQLAVNLINIAADRASQTVASTTPATQKVPQWIVPAQTTATNISTFIPSVPQNINATAQTAIPFPAGDITRHFGDSQIMPAVAIPDQATQSVPAQPFTV